MDTTTTDAKIEQAKASLNARAEELGRRISDVRHKLDIRGHIASHPHIAVGAAFAAGVLLALLTGGGGGGKSSNKRKVTQEEANKRTVTGMIGGAITALVMSAVKDFAFRQASGYARRYFGVEDPAMGPQAAASRQPATESFLQH